jgi:hypothetical protein
VRSNLQPQFFPESLAFLEALEELFEGADHNGVDADAFCFSPLFKGNSLEAIRPILARSPFT